MTQNEIKIFSNFSLVLCSIIVCFSIGWTIIIAVEFRLSPQSTCMNIKISKTVMFCILAKYNIVFFMLQKRE